MNYTCAYHDIFQIQDKLKIFLDEQLQISEERIALKSSESFTICSNAKTLKKSYFAKLKVNDNKAYRKNDSF